MTYSKLNYTKSETESPTAEYLLRPLESNSTCMNRWLCVIEALASCKYIRS